jgi:hypothetical protein
MGMFHEAFRDSSRVRSTHAKEVSNRLRQAIQSFADQYEVECEASLAPWVLVDSAMVAEYFNEYCSAQWNCQKYFDLAKANDHVRFALTGMEADDQPIIAVQFWVGGSTNPQLNCNEIFFSVARIRSEEEKLLGSSAEYEIEYILHWEGEE